MDVPHPSPSPELAARLDRLERQNRHLRLGAVLLLLGLAAVATTAFRYANRPQDETVRARTIELVDAAGRPAARIAWESGRLGLEVVPTLPPGVVGALGGARGGDSSSQAAPHGVGLGARLFLQPGLRGPSLVLTDGHGREILRLGGPVSRPIHE
jgi:hypothetical protein